MYGVKKMGAGHSFRAYFIIDSEQVVRARVVGDLPVALGMEEMVRQVKALKLAVTGVCVDGEGNVIGDWSWKLKPKEAVKKESLVQKMGLSMFQSNSSYYNKDILNNIQEDISAKMQSPVDISISAVVTNKMLGPITSLLAIQDSTKGTFIRELQKL